MANYFPSATKGYIASYAGLSKECWYRVFITFLNEFSGGVSFFLSLYFVNELHINVALSGILISSYGLGTVFGGIVCGKLADKFSPTRISIISLSFKALVFFAFLQLKLFPLLLINQFFHGFSTYGFKTSNNVWMLKQSKTGEGERLKILNILYTFANLSIGVAAVMVSILSKYGYQYIFMVCGTLLLVAVVTLILQDRRVPYVADSLMTPVEKERDQKVKPQRQKFTLFIVLGCVLLVTLVISQLFATYNIYIEASFPALGINAVTILFVLNSVLIVFFQTPFVNCFQQRNKILTMGIGALIFCMGMAMLSVADFFFIAVIACVVQTVGEMLFASMAPLVCYELGAAKKKGQALGVYQSTFACAIVVGPTLGGYIYHHFNGHVIWYLSGLIGVVCFVACAGLARYSSYK